MNKPMNRRKRKDTIQLTIIISVVLIILLFSYGIYLLVNRNTTDNLLIDSSKDVVYTSYENKEYDKEIPALNIVNLSDEINNNINEFVKPYVTKITNQIAYHYQINGNILSLFISVEDYEIEGAADVHFLSYIIDLKKLKVLTKDEILDMFQITEDSLVEMIDKNFKAYYESEKQQKIISSSMSYEKFLRTHEITNYIDQMYYDIVDAKLNVYLDYNQWTSDETESLLSNLGYVFEVK